MRKLILKYVSFEAYVALWNAALWYHYLPHFTIEETEACMKRGVTCSVTALSGSRWHLTPGTLTADRLWTTTLQGKKKKASFIASPELPWGESKINIFQLLITKSHHFLSYWCILISIKINQQPQHCPLLNLNHNTNSCTYIMHASGI